jgi:WD40 repeat protein
MRSFLQTICTASWDKTVRIFDANSGANLKVLIFGACICSQSKNPSINLNFPTFPKVFTGHSDKVVHVSQISDGRICSCALDANIRIWNIRSGVCEQLLSGHTLNSRWTVQVMNGQLVSCSRDKTIRFWDLKTSKTVKTLTGHSDYVRCLLLLADDRIVSGSDDHTMRVWG